MSYNYKPNNLGLGPAYTDDRANPYGGACVLTNHMNKTVREHPFYGGEMKNLCAYPMYMPQSETMPGMNWCGIRKNTIYPEFKNGFLDTTFNSSQHIPTKDILPGANNVMKRFVYNNSL